jgi:hypothetical protein
MYMKMHFLGLLLGFFNLIPAQGPVGAAPPSKPLWHTDYDQAKQIARRTGKPLFVVFR